MKIEMYLDRVISENLMNASKEREKKHKSSGKLSAGKLSHPTLWQVLHTIGVPAKEHDEYTLRKFKRGEHVEEWLVSHMPDVVKSQEFVEYKNVVGYVDAIVDSTNYDFKSGLVPHEVKSVTNAKFKWTKEPQKGHALQGALYALALDRPQFVIDYVASDDYRVKSFVLETADYKAEIDSIIEEYNLAMEHYKKTKELPKFEAREDWQNSIKYCPYPEYMPKTGQVGLFEEEEE